LESTEQGLDSAISCVRLTGAKTTGWQLPASLSDRGFSVGCGASLACSADNLGAGPGTEL